MGVSDYMDDNMNPNRSVSKLKPKNDVSHVLKSLSCGSKNIKISLCDIDTFK